MRLLKHFTSQYQIGRAQYVPQTPSMWRPVGIAAEKTSLTPTTPYPLPPLPRAQPPTPRWRTGTFAYYVSNVPRKSKKCDVNTWKNRLTDWPGFVLDWPVNAVSRRTIFRIIMCQFRVIASNFFVIRINKHMRRDGRRIHDDMERWWIHTKFINEIGFVSFP